MTNPGWLIARPVNFYRTQGKWHALTDQNHTVCGRDILIGSVGPEYIQSTVGRLNSDMHPVVCRRCLELSTQPGRSRLHTL